VPEIVYIADDFGLSEESNEAIVHAHRKGALTGTVLMMGQPGTEHAVELARANPSLQIGWHLHLVDSRPCTIETWPWGASHTRAGIALGSSPGARAAARREIEAQWSAFRDTGLECRFANAHHHLHIHPFVRRSMLAVMGSEFSGWLRWGRIRCFGRAAATIGYRLLDAALMAPHRGRLPCRESATLWGIDRTFRMRAEEIRRVLPTLGAGLHEFMFHPRSLDHRDTTCLLELADLHPQSAGPLAAAAGPADRGD
jgi:predicted glycoside hydrolase/deacetylase ChbG (UPF0249 family)